ncbi:MAG TPA: SGNH/GDSL hydrolase family protein, partial [Solirubrobacteraceae bacterium]|nr:SGNH/GDSL hydrolase family protein [Solirubrobacteraceae bacterium]
ANIGRGRAEPAVVVVGGSINDAGEDPRAVGASARRLYAYLARVDPAAKVVVVVFSPRIPAPANFAALDKAVLDAAGASPNVVGALDLPSAVPRTAAGVQAADGHPTQAGHDLYGRLIADFVRARTRR